MYGDICGEPFVRRALRNVDIKAVDLSRGWKIPSKVNEPNPGGSPDLSNPQILFLHRDARVQREAIIPPEVVLQVLSETKLSPEHPSKRS